MRFLAILRHFCIFLICLLINILFRCLNRPFLNIGNFVNFVNLLGNFVNSRTYVGATTPRAYIRSNVRPVHYSCKDNVLSYITARQDDAADVASEAGPGTVLEDIPC